MQSLDFYRSAFADYLNAKRYQKAPTNLYEPIDYILQLGGKRLRPVLVLMSAELFGSDYKSALDAAMAIELFHNFSLVHDDIMDDAPLRRGKTTVHEKWDANTGILSGDAMLIESYKYLEAYEDAVLGHLFRLFNTTAIGVCEGQQLDVDFESRTDVEVGEYLKMIELKTAVLIAAALQMGAIIARTNADNQALVYEFGRNLGIAFQLQDDYLDAFGDPKTFGKQVGGDIIENKKTFLYLKAIELADTAQQTELVDLYSNPNIDTDEKIARAKAIFTSSGAVALILEAVAQYTTVAFDSLHKLECAEAGKKLFEDFGKSLLHRQH